MTLSPKHEAFVREYLVDLNATQAAIRAGYSSNPATAEVTGHRLLRDAKIAAAIADAQAQRGERLKVTADQVVSLLWREAQGMADSTPASRVSALGYLAKHFGLLRDKIEHSGGDGQPVKFILINTGVPHRYEEEKEAQAQEPAEGETP